MYFPGLEDAPFKKNMGEFVLFFENLRNDLNKSDLKKIPVSYKTILNVPNSPTALPEE